MFQSLVGSGTGVGLWPGRRREVERVFERGRNIVERRAPHGVPFHGVFFESQEEGFKRSVWSRRGSHGLFILLMGFRPVRGWSSCWSGCE